MSRFIKCLLGILMVAVVVGGPIAYAKYHKATFRNLRVVREGVLYRSGQMSVAGLEQVIHDYGITTVISLRESHQPGDPPPDRNEEAYCRSNAIRYFRIPHQAWQAPAGCRPPVDDGVQRFLEIMDDPANYPVLIHCFAGDHRTGAFCGIYRMEYEGWSADKTTAEMELLGYDELDETQDVLEYLKKYQSRKKTGTEGTSLEKGRTFIQEEE